MPAAEDPVDPRGDGASERRLLALDAARVLYLSGVNTSSVIREGEAAAARLGAPGRVVAHWGTLELVGPEHQVLLAEARPEAVNMRAAQAVTDALAGFRSGRLDREGLRERVVAAERAPGSRLAAFTVAATVGAVALVALWGLSVPAGLVAVGVAAALGALARRGLAARHAGPVWQTFAAALIGGLVGAAIGATTSWSPGELVALGPALVLVPGPQLMNGGLDLAGGRIPLGIARLTSAMITIFTISAGVLLGLAVAGRTLPVTSPEVVLPPLLDVALAATASGAYAVFFDMPWRLLPVPVVVGGAAHLLHSVLAEDAGWNLAAASGAGALLAGALLIPLAARLRVPFAGIGFASVVAMMPSVYVHRAVSGLLQLTGGQRRGDPALLQAVADDAVTATLVIVALVLGVVIPIRLYRAVREDAP